MGNSNDAALLWQNMMGPLMFAPQEMTAATRDGSEGKWFSASSADGSSADKLVIEGALFNDPSADIPAPRLISREDFFRACPYYQDWKDQKPEAAEALKDIAADLEYIFGIVENYQ